MKREIKTDPFFTDQPDKSFIDELRSPLHAGRPSFFGTRVPETGEACVDGLYIAERFPDDTGLLGASYDDFQRFADVCGIAGDRYPVRIVREETGCFESFRISVGTDGTVVFSGDTEGVRRALIYLEDEMTRREGPYLPLGDISRQPVMRSRITRCFFSPINRPPKYGDELSDEIDYYPDEYLNRLMHDGANGVWIYTRFSDLVSVSAIPEYGRDSGPRIEKLNRVINKCARYGVKVYVFAIEPVALKDEYSRHIPQADGGKAYNGHLFCVNTPVGRGMAEEAGERLFTLCPGLGGLISITYGERPTSCSSAYSAIPEIGFRTEMSCPRCRGISPGQALANAAGALASGVHKASPDAEVISWTYGHRFWPIGDVKDYVRRSPEDAVLMQNFEEMGYLTQLGRKRQGVDYWLSCGEPSPLFRETAEEARRVGRRMYMKTQVCCSHEVASVPYVPVPGLLYEKYKSARDLGVEGVMQCWYFGNYPSIMSKAAGELAFESDFTDKRAFLTRLAGSFVGRSRAKALAAAWVAFEDGYKEYPLNIMFSYYGPMHDGPVWALQLKPKNFSLPRSWQTLDPTDGDRIGECLLEGHDLPEAITLTGRMSSRWHNGLELLKGVGDIPETAEQLSVAEALDIIFSSGHDILRFYRFRERLGYADGDPKRILSEMRRIVEREIGRSRRLSLLCDKDGRLGYHSEGEGYKYFPKKLTWRADRLRKLLESEFPETEARIEQGLPPLAYYAGEELDAKAYRITRGDIGPAGWESVGERAAFRAAYDESSLTVDFRSDVSESVHVGFEFRLMWPSPPVRIHPDGRVEIPPEDYLYYSVFGRTLKRITRLWNVKSMPAETGTYIRIVFSRSEAGWSVDRPLKMRLETQSGEKWCCEDDPVHTLGKSSVSPGEYGWLLP
ncbi:MAG: hypothetical protein K6D94_10990 [Clostridiales bacterium]|nr:hypothetical protein [Clostridiales bacterium]